MLLFAVVAGALTAFANQMVQKPAAPAESDKSRDADRAVIEKLHQQYIAATLSRDPVALTELWTDDAIRLGPGHPAEVGKQAIRESNARWAARRGLKVLTYVSEIKDLTLWDGRAAAMRTFVGTRKPPETRAIDEVGRCACLSKFVVSHVTSRLRDSEPRRVYSW